jgi:hypothetical protein
MAKDTLKTQVNEIVMTVKIELLLALLVFSRTAFHQIMDGCGQRVDINGV